MNKASENDGIPVELFQMLKDDAVKVLHLACQQIWKTQQWPQDWKRSVFIPISKKGNDKECSNYPTIALILNDNKAMLKIPQVRLQHKVNWELPDVQNAEDTKINCQHPLDHRKSKRILEKTSTSASSTMPKPLTVWITTNWKILQTVGIPDHLTCLLRHLYVGQKATVRTGHATTDWFQIGKGVHQGCILSPCLFNLYPEYIMQHARLD